MEYWHIQMHLPQGRDGTIINSLEMLKEPQPIIGTGEWDDFQCRNFKNGNGHGLSFNDIILVRIGKRPVALCKVIDHKSFTDNTLTTKYLNRHFRKVEILDFFTNDEDDFPQAQGTLQHLTNEDSTSYEYIDARYNNYLKKFQMKQITEILTKKKQIILQGPPGTGKTYSAKDMAELLIYNEISSDKKVQKKKLEETDQFKLIQFHPAYSYEDFVRGITAKSTDNKIEYITENKVLAKFAKLAAENWKLSSSDTIKFVAIENWVQSTIDDFKEYLLTYLDENDEKLMITPKVYISRITDNSIRYNSDAWEVDGGVPVSDLLKMYLAGITQRREVKDLTTLTKTAKSLATYWYKILELFKKYIDDNKLKYDEVVALSEEKKYILIIDEINRANLPAVLGELIYALEYRGEKVESMYDIDEDNSLVIPPNLLIIGTMNTSDRSVGHIDYAIRRRFAFVDVLPKILDNGNFETDYFKKVSELFITNFDEYVENKEIILVKSQYLSEEFRPEDVWLGHSYFITNDIDFTTRLKYEIKPILKEYIKDGILKQTAEIFINNL